MRATSIGYCLDKGVISAIGPESLRRVVTHTANTKSGDAGDNASI